MKLSVSALVSIPIKSTLLAIAIASTMVACGSGSDDPPPVPTTPPPPPPAPPPPPPPPAAVPEATLKQLAAKFPKMPKELVELIALRGPSSGTFSSGLPLNDLEYTLFDTDYIDGETNGYDTFMPVDPSQPFPGADQIKIVNATGNVTLDSTYGGQGGDRIILGTAEIANPFFMRGGDGVDNDYAVITSFNYKLGHIQLRGTAADYGLVRCTIAEGCATDGFYLFHTAGAQPDLVAFVFKCDDLPGTAGGNQPQTTKAMCNTNETLSLADSNQFKFATAVSTTVALSGQTQIGTIGKEIVGGVATDTAGNQYLVGQTDGSFNGGAAADNRVFAARINADGSRGWVYELPIVNGSLFFDAITDSEHLYAVGRTLGALPGKTNAGRWDAIILKLRLTDGALVASSQWGNAGLDGYGNVVLDDAGNLFVSGAGSASNSDGGTDPFHLVAKYRASDLSNVWRQVVEPNYPGGRVIASSEAWGGLSYVASTTPGQGKLVAGGWFMGSGDGGISAQAFLEVWSDLHLATPRRSASTVIASPGVQADWVLDNAVDSAGNIYAVGFTSGSLQGPQLGAGDAYIVKYDANLQNPVFRQVGTAHADAFRRMRIDSADNIYAVGYTYGDYAGSNADANKRSGDVILQKFDRSLNPIASLQIGTPHEERSYMSYRNGTVYLGGMTEAALAGKNNGSFDAFVVKVDAQSMKVKP
jgi:hypothetical protein